MIKVCFVCSISFAYFSTTLSRYTFPYTFPLYFCVRGEAAALMVLPSRGHHTNRLAACLNVRLAHGIAYPTV